MKAWINHKYACLAADREYPEILQLEETEKPKVKENHLLVKVKVNPVDWRT